MLDTLAAPIARHPRRISPVAAAVLFATALLAHPAWPSRVESLVVGGLRELHSASAHTIPLGLTAGTLRWRASVPWRSADAPLGATWGGSIALSLRGATAPLPVRLGWGAGCSAPASVTVPVRGVVDVPWQCHGGTAVRVSVEPEVGG